MIARNRRQEAKILSALVLLVVAIPFLLYVRHNKIFDHQRHVCVISNDERRFLTLYDIQQNRLVTHLCMDDIGGNAPVQYIELVSNSVYVYISAIASQAVFNAVWETVGKSTAIRKNEDLANVSGCIYFKGDVINNVRLAHVGDLIKTIMQQSVKNKRREIPYEKGEERRLDIVDVSTNLWRLRGRFSWGR